MNRAGKTGWITLSVRLYRALLMLYPADYRREYGAMMVQLFRDVARDKYRKQGRRGIVLWWCVTLADLALTIVEQWRKANFTMSRQTFIHLLSQLTGILLVIGGVCCIIGAFSQLQPDNHYSYYGIFQACLLLLSPGYLFVGLGCIGLGLNREQSFGTFGQGSLYLSGIGALAMAVGLPLTFARESLWNIWMVSDLLYTAALATFGLMHLWKPWLPVFRALPLMMAAGWLVALSGILRFESESVNNTLSFLFYAGMGLAWLAIGLVIHRQQSATEKTKLEVAPGNPAH